MNVPLITVRKYLAMAIVVLVTAPFIWPIYLAKLLDDSIPARGEFWSTIIWIVIGFGGFVAWWIYLLASVKFQPVCQFCGYLG